LKLDLGEHGETARYGVGELRFGRGLDSFWELRSDRAGGTLVGDRGGRERRCPARWRAGAARGLFGEVPVDGLDAGTRVRAPLAGALRTSRRRPAPLIRLRRRRSRATHSLNTFELGRRQSSNVQSRMLSSASWRS